VCGVLVGVCIVTKKTLTMDSTVCTGSQRSPDSS
jgi:hypothetical protein